MRGRRGDFLVVKFLATVVTGAHGVVARGGGAARSVVLVLLFVSAGWR
jgi:hypothetical protein